MIAMNDSHQMSVSQVSDWDLKQWMKVALNEGEAGTKRGENPFGAAIYGPDGELVTAACNTVASTCNPSAHAEVNAIAAACQSLDRRKLSDCWLIATAEPCLMCLSCAAIAGIRNIAFGASQAVVQEAGYGGLGLTGRELAEQLNANLTLRGSVLGNECASFLLSNRKPQRGS